jgi:N-acetylglutamate synthase-like GNAT family acetyltransferase
LLSAVSKRLGASEIKKQIGNYEGTENFLSRSGARVSKARDKEAVAEAVEALTGAMAMQPQKAVQVRTPSWL